MNPADNFELAKILEKPPKGAPPEAAFRGACGRAYYFAFASVREALLAGRFSIPKNGTGHGVIIDLLKKSQDKDVQAAGSLLDQLRVTRNSADYEVGSIKTKGMPFESYRAQLSIAHASSVVSAVNKSRAADSRIGIP